MNRRRPHRRPGVALIIVLGMIITLALLVTGMMETLRTRLVEGERRDARDELRAAAESALAVAQGRLAVFESDPEGFRLNVADLAGLSDDPLSGRPSPAGLDVAVEARDESGRFALNTGDTDALRRLFTDLGVADDIAGALADRLADATDGDDSRRASGAESDDYDTPALPPNRPLTGFSELRSVKGFDAVFFNPDGTPNDLGRRLAAVTTFLGSNDRPDINGANDATLALLCERLGGDAEAIRAYLQPLDYPNDRTHRGVIRSAATLGLAGAPPEFAERVSYGAKLVRVTIRVSNGPLRHTTDALLAPSGSRTAPVRIVKRVDNALLAEPEPTEPTAAESSAEPDPANAGVRAGRAEPAA